MVFIEVYKKEGTNKELVDSWTSSASTKNSQQLAKLFYDIKKHLNVESLEGYIIRMECV